MVIFLLYLIGINIFAAVITIADKIAAKRELRRTRERTLMLIAAVGGSPMMLLIMLLIRHKTRKPKFMIGIPVILAVQLLVCYLVAKYGFKII